MNRVVLHSRVGADGVLHISVPMGESDAGREVQVTIDPVGPSPMTQEEWRKHTKQRGELFNFAPTTRHPSPTTD